MSSNLKETTVWSGEYRNIRFEIKRFKAFDHQGNDYSWCHYIYINLDNQIPEKEVADKFWLPAKPWERPSGTDFTYDYYDSIISELEFHGGCTFYAKVSSIDSQKRVVQIGCDYQHLCDSGKNYTLPYVENCVQETIDSLWRITPIKTWCWKCGNYFIEHCEKCKDPK